MGNIKKYMGLTLVSSGHRINFRNVNMVKFQLVDNIYVMSFRWKYKASIRTEEFQLKNPDGFQLNDYFKQWGLIPFGPDAFINPNGIIMIEEVNHIRGPIDYTQLRLIFTDGYEYNHKIKSDYWNWWRSNFS